MLLPFHLEKNIQLFGADLKHTKNTMKNMHKLQILDIVLPPATKKCDILHISIFFLYVACIYLYIEINFHFHFPFSSYYK